MVTELVFFVGVALLFGFLNGFNGSANTVATMISSRAMRPRQALMLSAAAHFVGPFLFGVAVARTIGQQVVAAGATTLPVVLAALLAAVGWSVLTWRLGIPSSSSDALIGGLVGAAACGHGWQAILLPGLLKVLLALSLSPLLGLLAGFLLMKLALLLGRAATPRVNLLFKRAQIVTALALALSHGTNDAQKTMGLIAMGLLASGVLPTFQVPPWVVFAAAAAMALGTALGGWRIIRTLGARFYRIRPIHGFASQLAAAAVILGAAVVGGPVSTTHIVSTTILGAGSAERLNKVRWGVAREIVTAWVLTMPATGLLAALLYLLLSRMMT